LGLSQGLQQGIDAVVCIVSISHTYYPLAAI